MIKALLFDFSRTLLFPKDRSYKEGLNSLHKKLSESPDYIFFEHFELNKEILHFLDRIKDKVSVYMFTSESIQETSDLKPIISKTFVKVFSAKMMSLDKKNPNSYLLISKDINIKPEEIVFVDDSLENIEAAIKAGFKTIRYTDNKELFNELSKFNISLR